MCNIMLSNFHTQVRKHTHALKHTILSAVSYLQYTSLPYSKEFAKCEEFLRRDYGIVRDRHFDSPPMFFFFSTRISSLFLTPLPVVLLTIKTGKFKEKRLSSMKSDKFLVSCSMPHRKECTTNISHCAGDLLCEFYFNVRCLFCKSHFFFPILDGS